MNHAKRVDGNQKELVEWLRAQNLKVVHTHMVGEGFPDLVVGGELPCPHCGQTFWQVKLVEVKMPGKGLNDEQAWWWQEKWGGGPAIAHDREELAALLGLIGAATIRDAQAPDQDYERAKADWRRQAQEGRHPRRARRVP